MRHNYTQPQSPQTYRRIYAGFKGIDTVNAPIHVDVTRSPYAQNVIVDAAGVVHKRPPFHLAVGYERDNNTIHGIFPFLTEADITGLPSSRNNLLVHKHTELLMYRGVTAGDLPPNPVTLCTDLNPADSSGFQYGRKFFLMDGKTFRVIMLDETTEEYVVKTVQEIATAPETQIDGYYHAEEYTDGNGDPQVEYTWTFGEKGERNLLTARRINTFAGDGVHTKFYMDVPNMHVTKVEIYNPTQAAAGTGATVTTINYAQSNVRNKPSQTNGAIIGRAPANTTYKTYGKQGKWYKIEFPGAAEAYIHQDRIATYTPGTPGTEVVSNTDEWEEITTGYTIREATTGDDVLNCTVIEFTTAPGAHPRGTGLPNIRVTGAELETVVISKKQPSGAGQSNITIIIPNSDIVINTEVKINGTVQTLGTDYIVEKDDNRQTCVTVYGIVNNVQKLHSGDTVTLTYKRENLRDYEIINQCDKFGKYGVYNNDRFWYTGNIDDINRDWYSEPSDPTLVLENSYTEIGSEMNGIAGYLNYQSDMLIVKYDGESECLYRRTSDSDGDMTIFPVKAYVGRGAVNSHALVNAKGMALYLSPEGLMEFASSDLGSKYSVQNRSYLVNNVMSKTGATLGLYNDHLIVTQPDDSCYVADLNKPTAPNESGGYGYEWVYWTNVGIRLSASAYYTLWFTRGNDICAMPLDEETYHYADYPSGLNGQAEPIEAIWTTACDILDEPARYKYIERRGFLLNLYYDHKNPAHPSQTSLKYAVITDSKDVPVSYDSPVKMLSEPTDYDVIDLSGAPDTPLVLVNERIPRFRYIQFVFANDDPETDGIQILSLEFQYRFGRYII